MAEQPTPILVVSSAERQELFSTYNALPPRAVEGLEKAARRRSDAEWGGGARPYRLCPGFRVITHPRARLRDGGTGPRPPRKPRRRQRGHRPRVLAVGA